MPRKLRSEKRERSSWLYRRRKMERWQGKCQGVDKGRNCGLAVGCAGEEFHQRWQLHTWLWRKVRWSMTEEVGMGTKAVVVALISHRGRGERRKEKLRSTNEK